MGVARATAPSQLRVGGGECYRPRAGHSIGLRLRPPAGAMLTPCMEPPWPGNTRLCPGLRGDEGEQRCSPAELAARGRLCAGPPGGPASVSVELVLERLTGLELRRLGSRDLDGLARLGVAAGTGLARRDGERAEARDVHLVAVAE